MTKSAAVRISDAARAMDVTQLLRRTLRTLDGNSDQDVLVLVATLFHTPPVQFPHEIQQNINATNAETESVVSEPLHVVKTLKPNDNPLTVRDALLVQLQQRQQQQSREQKLSPKLQWFFVPSTCQMPNCIQLDGYCTADESESDVDDSDSDTDDTITEPTVISNEYWWRTQPDPVHQQEQQDSEDEIHCHSSSNKQQLQKEQRRWNQLQNAQTALLDRPLISGYLLKRSHKDPHVWRRVYCVVTDQHLWIVHRLRDNQGMSPPTTRISLNRALLLEATAEYAPLFQTPYSFQVVNKSGISHDFRASTAQLQQEWIACIKCRITQCQDNDLMQHAELIVQDEALARSKRRMAVAVEPLLHNVKNNGEQDERRRKVLHWSLDVAEYRELCRHVFSRMPAKRPVVVALSDSDLTAPSPRRLFDSPQRQQDGDDHGSIVDDDTRSMIRSAWDLAAVLLARATVFARVEDGRRPMSSSLDTMIRHADYVITGRFRSLGESGEPTAADIERSCDPPPANLFDALLAELQSGCSSNKKKDGSMNGHAMDTPLAS